VSAAVPGKSTWQVALVLAACGAPLLACAGCKGNDDPFSGISKPMRERARLIYEARCLGCHGKTGAADGPDADKCNPKVRSFKSGGWNGIVTNKQIELSIVGGGAAIGKSVQMPPNPDLRDKPELIRAIRAHVRSLAK